MARSSNGGYSRRDFGKIALASLPAGALLTGGLEGRPLFAQAPSSVINGVTIGMIGNLGIDSTDPPALAAAVARIGLSAVELGGTAVEAYAGAPAGQARGRGRAAMTPEQEAAQQQYLQEIRAWRQSPPTAKFQEYRKHYNDAGIRIAAFRITLTEAMSDAEYDYAFNTAKLLGAQSLTMELPASGALTKRIGDFAAKHRLMTGYHTHLQATPTIFDEALSQSPYNGIQLDIGHYVAATSESPIPLIARHHARITSMHLKDRKVNAGPNMPWGEGDTPIAEVLQLMKKERYTWPAFIELEYPVPEGSTRVAEIGRCLEYCRKALA